jgi:formylglycine-generating enzyme required for sulfatase activity
MPFPKVPDWGWKDDFPIVNVSWNDIMGSDGKGGFAAWASHVAGVSLSLPNEAQFEYAACGGKVGNPFPWGTSFNLSYLWCSEALYADATKPAGVFRKARNYVNAFRLTDMIGNVQQWCRDGYLPYRSDVDVPANARQIRKATSKVIRGFGWNELDPEDARCSARSRLPPDSISNTLGFRLVAPSE